ncbi:MAG: ornithine--oxo-acid transaminase [Sphingomonadales bacterium]|jgi:ornithine--oxo-acid transaminase
MTARELEDQYGAHNYHPLPVVLTRGEGVWVWDEDGKRYLDMMSAYSAVSHGHRHPRIIKALKDQLDRIAVTSRAYYTDKLGAFLKKLCDVAQMDMALPMNTGAEAVETAIKAARRWGYQVKGIEKDQAEIIVVTGNFHGRTTTIVGFSSDEEYKQGFGPFTPGFRLVEYGDAKALAEAITPNTCAILMEPIQGEAGIVVPPQGYLREARRLCDENNVLLILDEIQSGLARTGKMFAFEHESIRPDGLILGKALGGGVLPVSAFLASKEVMELFNPGSHGSTFGGNPLAAAVGAEALDVILDENLVERSAEQGEYLKSRIAALNSPLITEVRGKGLWIGVEIDPKLASARDFCERMKAKGVLSKETHATVVRLAPPLVISREDLDWGIDRFVEVIREMEAELSLNSPATRVAS